MKPIQQLISNAFRQAIQNALSLDAEPMVTSAQNPNFGDYQCNAAMGLVRRVSEQTDTKTNPRQIAEQIKTAAEPLLQAMASELSIAGPGFINVRLKSEWLASRVASAG